MIGGRRHPSSRSKPDRTIQSSHFEGERGSNAYNPLDAAAGTLELLIDPDEETTLASLVGVTFDLFDWTGVAPVGQFQRILTENGLVWDTADLYTSGVVTLIDVPGYIPGDFDGDYDVDGADFLAWQRGEVSNPPSAEDLALLEAHFGTTSTLSSSTSIPEPSSFVLLLAAFACSLPIQRLI